MPERGSRQDSPFLFVTIDEQGRIASASVFFALPSDARRAVDARALIQGAKSFHVYRIHEKPPGELSFERVR